MHAVKHLQYDWLELNQPLKPLQTSGPAVHLLPLGPNNITVQYN